MTTLSQRTKKIGCVGHDCDDCKKQKREVTKQRKALQHLSDTVMVFLHRLDEQVGPDKRIPKELGRLMAAWANDLDMVNDAIRFNVLGVDFRKDNKARAVQKLMRSNVEFSGSAQETAKNADGSPSART